MLRVRNDTRTCNDFFLFGGKNDVATTTKINEINSCIKMKLALGFIFFPLSSSTTKETPLRRP
jgi:hypothetical protein